MGKAASTGASPVAASLRVFGKVSVVVPASVSAVPVSALPESPVVAITVGVMTAPAATAPAAPITARRVTRDVARWEGEKWGNAHDGSSIARVVLEDTTESPEWSHSFRHHPPTLAERQRSAT
jgi:hypothetical protein